MHKKGAADRGHGFGLPVRGRAAAAAVAACMLVLGIPAGPVEAAPKRTRPRPVFEVRPTYTGDFGISRPVGLAYDPSQNALLVAAADRGATRVVRFTPTQDHLGASVLPVSNPRTLAFDAITGRAALLDGNDLVTARIGGRGSLRPATHRVDLRAGDLATAGGAAFEPGGALLVLDPGDRSILRASGTGASRRTARISLSRIGKGLRGIAVNPADGLVYVMNPRARLLYAIDRSGTIKRVYTLGSLRLVNPTAITFAPSADTTDDPATMHLFIADAGGSSTSGSVTEVRLTQISTSVDVPTVTANLVQTIDTSLFNPASPDPAGIVYMPDRDRLMIADSEVDETTGAGYHGVNMWQLTRTGSVTDTGTTLAYSREPTGLGYDPATETLFVSSDDNRKVWVVRAGPDGRFGTSDDAVTFIDAAAYGSTDTEDPEFDPASGHLFFIDGINTEVYRINPVNGIFGDNDDIMTHFDVGAFGATDVEGLGLDESRDTLLVGDRIQRKIYEVTKAGELVRMIDARVPGMMLLSGLGTAPASNSGQMNYWVVDRAVDNGPDPNENDGKLFELSVTPSGNQAPVVNSVVIDQSAPRTNDTLTVTVSASDPDGDPLTFSYQWNKNGVAIPGATGSTHDLSVPGNGSKGDRISVRVTASDGQALGVRTSSQVTIANSFPVFGQDIGDRTDSEGATVSLSSGASDPDAETLAYGATGLPPGMSIDPATGLISGTIAAGAAANSPYNVSVTVSDAVTGGSSPEITLVQKKSGDQTATAGNTISVTFDSPPNEGNLLVGFGHASANRTPTIPPGWNLALETGSSAETVVFYRIAGQNEPSTVTYSVSGADVFMGLAIFEYAGLHAVQSEVLDRVAFGSASNVTSVSTGTTQPTSQADELLIGSVSLNVTRTFQNSWINGFQRQTVDRRQTIADRIVSQTNQFQTAESWDSVAANATGALVTFKRATSPQPDPNPGSATDTFTWFVTPGGGGGEGTPVVNSVTVTPSSPRTNDTLTAQVDAIDPDGDPLTLSYQWTKNGTDIAGATASTLDLSQPGNGDKGDVIRARVRASDGSSVSNPVTSSGVTVANSPPTFNQDIGNQTNSEGDSIALSAAATDPDGDALTYAASGLPGGVSISSSTGLISGTIAAGAAAGGPYGVSVTVREGTAVDATDTFSWTVNAPAAPAQPSGLTGTPTTTNTILAWNPNTEAALAGYNVYRSASAGGPFTKLNGSLLTTTSFTDATAPAGTSHYRVTAQDTAGPESIPAETSVTRRIVFRSSVTKATKDTTTLTINRPSGIAAGDLMVAALDVLGAPVITAPSGWTQVRVDTNGSVMRQAVYYRVATANEAKSYSWKFSTKGSAAGIILAYQGAVTATPITDGDSGQANGASTSIFAPGVSTTVQDTLLVGFFGMSGNPTIAPPPEMFERAEISQNGGPNKIVLEAADAILQTAGPSGSRTATGAQSQPNIGQLVAVRPQL